MSIVKKLSTLDVKDVAGLLKNFDARQAKDLLLNQPHIFINVLLFFVAFAVTAKVFVQHGMALSKMKTEITLQGKKLQVVNDHKSVQAEYDVFLKQFLPHMETNVLIKYISDLALKQNIQMQSFTPADAKENDFWLVTKVNINVVSDNYQDIIVFVKQLEESGNFIRIANWNAKLQSSASTDKRPEQVSVVSTMDIESVKLKK
jgi:Tfp pilus assembly protein PilO